MRKLHQAVQKTAVYNHGLPFSTITNAFEPWGCGCAVGKPALIVVLNGEMRVCGDDEHRLSPGGFALLASWATAGSLLDEGNENASIALSVRFDQEDFDALATGAMLRRERQFVTGSIDSTLETILVQFIEWAPCVPTAMWPARRREILQYLQQVVQVDLSSLAVAQTVSTQVFRFISERLTETYDLADLCDTLAMSESTLRRRLKAEGTSLLEIRDRARLGHGLNLIQTTSAHIAEIANRCGYQSQSRFTEKFRRLFGVTPTELRRSRKGDHQRIGDSILRDYPR